MFWKLILAFPDFLVGSVRFISFKRRDGIEKGIESHT